MNDRPASPAIVLVKSDVLYGNSLEAKLPSWRVFAKLKVAGFFINKFWVLFNQVVFEFHQRLDLGFNVIPPSVFDGLAVGHAAEVFALTLPKDVSANDVAPVSYTHLTLPTKRIV